MDLRSKLRFCLLQVRNPGDPMRAQEVRCFVQALGVEPHQIAVLDLLSERPTAKLLDRADVVLFGGSGDYGAHGEEAWLHRALDFLRLVCDRSHPTFAGCWGFQAMGRALGGKLITDPENKEVGTHEVELTPDGERDPIFGRLPKKFLGQMGHRDRLRELPPGAIHLARSAKVENQAYTFPGKPIYATQFHPELRRENLHERLEQYPHYADRSEVLATLRDTPEANQLLKSYLQHVFGA